ncbi:MAG: hypothetical protein AABW48_03135 [Nanoarchaeota archaeon]
MVLEILILAYKSGREAGRINRRAELLDDELGDYRKKYGYTPSKRFSELVGLWKERDRIVPPEGILNQIAYEFGYNVSDSF